MKKLLLVLLGIAVFMSPAVLQAGDITSPSDPVVGVPSDGDCLRLNLLKQQSMMITTRSI